MPVGCVDEVQRAPAGVAGAVIPPPARAARCWPLHARPDAVAVQPGLANFGAFGYGDVDYARIGFTR